MKCNRFSRRMFLQGTGGTFLSIPFLPSLMTISERAAAATILPKYVQFNSNFCLPRCLTYPLYFDPYPTYTQPANTTPNSVPWIQKDVDTKYQSLADIIKYQGKISWTIDQKWNAFAARMNLVTNAHAYVACNNHNSSISSCASSGINGLFNSDVAGPISQYAYSTDWLIEQALARTAPAKIPALRFNLYQNDGGYDSFAFGQVNGKGARLYMMQTLGELSQKIGAAVGGGNTTDPAVTRRLSRVDSVLEDFNRLLNHRRISSVDKERLNQAAEMWHSVDSRLRQSSSGGGTCSAPNLPVGLNWGDRHRLAMDAIAAALACGATRVVNYGIIQGGDNMNDQEEMHGWDHDPREPNQSDPQISNRFFSLVRWRSDLVAYFLSKMDGLLDENGQSLLNSSLVTWGHQFSDYGHSMFGHALVSVGGAGGRLDTGWHVDAGQAPVNRFHLTNMMAMGLTQLDIEKNGLPGYGEIATPISTGDSSNSVITREQDAKTNDPTKRKYDTTKLSYFQQTAERRKPFPYLKPII